MTTEVHLLAYNESAILPYTMKHYRTFADRIVVHVATDTTDDTRELAKFFCAEVRDWNTNKEFNEVENMNLKNRCWKGTKADWVICADCDELIYFPFGADNQLQDMLARGIAIVKPQGWEIESEMFPTTTGQIYDEVKYGARDDKWYAKPILFNTHLVHEIGLGHGAHACRPLLKNGQQPGNPTVFTDPPVLLLHCKHLGPLQRIAEGYDVRRSRLSAINVERKWGNFDPGAKHAQDKRAYIKAHLQALPLTPAHFGI